MLDSGFHMHTFNTQCIVPLGKQTCVCPRMNVRGVENDCIRKRCTRQPALTAERNVKFRSSQTRAGQCTAESATQNEDHHAGTKPVKLTV
jgi:hypothetical protein